VNPIIARRRRSQHRQREQIKGHALPRGDRQGIISVRDLSSFQTEVLQQLLTRLLVILIMTNAVILPRNCLILLINQGKQSISNTNTINHPLLFSFLLCRFGITLLNYCSPSLVFIFIGRKKKEWTFMNRARKTGRLLGSAHSSRIPQCSKTSSSLSSRSRSSRYLRGNLSRWRAKRALKVGSASVRSCRPVWRRRSQIFLCTSWQSGLDARGDRGGGELSPVPSSKSSPARGGRAGGAILSILNPLLAVAGAAGGGCVRAAGRPAGPGYPRLVFIEVLRPAGRRGEHRLDCGRRRRRWPWRMDADRTNYMNKPN
jgi:hypothetical protein